MSLRSKNRKLPQVNIDSARLHDAQDVVSKSARQAAQRVGPTTREARKIAARQMKNARRWGAPRIDQAGQYFEEEVGPRVGAMLHRTATKVEPAKPRRRRGIGAVLLLIGGAIGAAGAIVTRRKAASSGESSPEDLSSVSANSSSEHAQSKS